jgi:acetoin utilization protein AcuB
MQVLEVMSDEPVLVSDTATLEDAWELLQNLDVRHLPVVNGARELVGVLSDRDFAARPRPNPETEIVGPSRLEMDRPVVTIMSSNVLSVTPEDEVEEVIDLMLDNKIGSVPVINPEGRVVGIVSYLDLLRTWEGEMS